MCPERDSNLRRGRVMQLMKQALYLQATAAGCLYIFFWFLQHSQISASPCLKLLLWLEQLSNNVDDFHPYLFFAQVELSVERR